MANTKSKWRSNIFQNPFNKYDSQDLLYHTPKPTRFGINQLFRVVICRLLGHRVSDDPEYNTCARCGLAYEEIYHKIGEGWFIESGIVSKDSILENMTEREVKELIKDIE